MGGWADGWVDGRADGWMGGCMGGCMGGWIDGWMTSRDRDEKQSKSSSLLLTLRNIETKTVTSEKLR